MVEKILLTLVFSLAGLAMITTQQLSLAQQPPKTVLVPPPAAQQQILTTSNYATAMINELDHRLGNDTSMAHAAQVLKQMTAEGKISCPAPFSKMGHCLLIPPGAIKELPVPPLPSVK